MTLALLKRDGEELTGAPEEDILLLQEEQEATDFITPPADWDVEEKGLFDAFRKRALDGDVVAQDYLAFFYERSAQEGYPKDIFRGYVLVEEID